MKSCSSVLCVLLSLFTIVSAAVPSVRVKLHGSATLFCSKRCSGVVRWTMFHKPDDVLAQCNQTSCRSQEGFQVIHDQYLNGNLSLSIYGADFSRRGVYTCDCDGKDLCDVKLLIEPLNTSVQIKPGESLVLDLDVPDPVEVVYYSRGAVGPYSVQICTVSEHSLQCKPNYRQRTSLTSVLELRGMTLSDSGIYIIRDQWNKEDIHIYSVTVKDDPSDLNTEKGASVSVWSVPQVATVLITVFEAVFVGAAVILIVCWWREIQQF